MFNLKEYLQDEIALTKKLLKQLDNNHYKDYDGTMVCKTRNGKTTYYKQIRNKDKKRISKLIGNENSKEVIRRKEKRYLEELQRKLQKNLTILENILPKVYNCTPEEIYDSLPNSYKCGNTHHQLNTQIENNEIFKLSDSKNPYEFNEVCSTTVTGEKVRSKGEALIFNLLYVYGVDFIYEKGVELKDYNGAKVTKYPDFTIFLKNGKHLFWEHLGKIYDYDYCITFAKKLHVYQHNNILMGKNLIVTSDSENSCTFTAEISDIIKNLILPICKMAK